MQDNFIKWKERPFSWSQMSSFEYSPEQWYKKYYLNEPPKDSREMNFGKITGERIASDPTYKPEIPREKIMEHGITTKLDDITLIGYFDSYDEETKTLQEYKTGKKPWTKKRVNDHGQLTFYCLLLWLDKGIQPEDVTISLHWIPTIAMYESLEEFLYGKESIMESGEDTRHFTTKRTSEDVDKFIQRIKDTRVKMAEFIHTMELAESNDVR